MATHDQFIGGEWVKGDSYAPNVNPSNLAESVGEYARADKKQAEAAIHAARAAAAGWAQSGIQARSDALDAIGSEILERREELGRLLAREEGKTLKEGIGEVARAGYVFKYFGGEVLRTGGELMPSVRPGVRVEVTREALGVVGIITPWNFPIAIPAWKIAPALAFGNSVVFKPADLTPGCGWAIADIISRAGIPDGVFNLVIGKGFHRRRRDRQIARSRRDQFHRLGRDRSSNSRGSDETPRESAARDGWEEPSGRTR